MNFVSVEVDGEPVRCDSCDCEAPVASFDWGPPFTDVHDKPMRMLCEFCCSTMASNYTRFTPRDEHTAIRAEIWKAAAAVYNMLKRGEK